jgi:hypothetical protein
MKVNPKQLQKSSSRIVTDQQLKKTKMEHLMKHGFRQDSTFWTNGTRRVRASLVNDAEIPFSVFVNIVSKSIQASKEKKTNPKKRKTKPKLAIGYKKQDALDYRLPGSYGTGKRR